MKIGFNGNSIKVGLPMLITIVILIVNLAVTIVSKADADKVQACETRIVILEEQQATTRDSVSEIKVMLKTISDKQETILLKVTSIEALRGSRGTQ